MKKIVLLLAVILLPATFVFGQVKTENKKGTKGLATGGYKSNRQEVPPKNNTIDYNDRSYQNYCYRNFAFTVKNYGFNKDAGFYSWGVVVKNNYSKAVQLKYKLVVGNDNPKDGTLTYYIKPGETYSNDFGKVNAIIVKSNSDQFRIEVSEVCFEGQDCAKNGYVDCNGKPQSSKSIESNKTVSQRAFSKEAANKSASGNGILKMTEVDIEPEYPGGIGQAYKFIGNNLIYPSKAAENNIQGTVVASFIVELDGSITDIQITQKIGYGCDEEVVKVLQAMPKWSPGMKDGQPIRVKYNFPVKFALSN